MRKKILSLVLACIMVIAAASAAIPAFAAADQTLPANSAIPLGAKSTYVNDDGTIAVYTASNNTALTEAKGKLVTFHQDADFSSLEMKTSNYTNINVIGVKEDRGTKLTVTKSGKAGIIADREGSQIHIENLTIDMKTNGWFLQVTGNNCTVTFKNCTINLTQKCDASAYMPISGTNATLNFIDTTVTYADSTNKKIFINASGAGFEMNMEGNSSITGQYGHVVSASAASGTQTINMYDTAAIRLTGSNENANAIQSDNAGEKLTINLNDSASIVTDGVMNNNYGSAIRTNNQQKDVVITMRGNSYIDSNSCSENGDKKAQATIAVNTCKSFTLKMYDNAYIDSWEAYKTIKTYTVKSNIYLFDNAIIKANGYNTIKFWDYTNGHNTTIHAEYTTFSAYGQSASYKALDIVDGASVRMVDGDTGIRFTVNLTNAITERSKDELAGVIIAEYADIANADFTKESLAQNNYAGLEFAVPNATDDPVSEFLKGKLDADNNLKIALNIDEADYETEYAIRTYVKYNFEHKHSDNDDDIRKFPLVIYSDFSVANHVRSVADVAGRALNDTETEETTTHNCKIEDGVWSRYTKAQVETLKVIAGDYKGASEFTLTQANITTPVLDSNTGVYYRNVNIDAANVEGDTITVVQFNDVHFDLNTENSWTDKPYDTKTKANNALTYAQNANADRVVVVGDVMSDESQANIDAMDEVFNQSTIFDPEKIIMCIGNHDARENQSGSETTSLKDRLEVLEAKWKNDLYYSSDVIEEKVMIIQMDNASQAGGTGKSAFWDAQVPLLKADLDTARANGYVVLIFYHIPLATNNSEDNGVMPVTVYGDGAKDKFANGCNYYNDSNLVGANSTGASKQIYDLITNNADVIAATFCGHMHADFCTEIAAKTALGEDRDIPQYVLVGNVYDGGHVINITVS